MSYMNMTLLDWIKAEKLSYRQAAVRLGLSNGTVVRRYALHLARPPRPERMEQIYIRSGYKVNDWYRGTSDDLPRPNGADHVNTRLVRSRKVP